MLSLTFSSRRALSVLASVLLHALAWWAVSASVLQQRSLPPQEPRLQVLLLPQPIAPAPAPRTGATAATAAPPASRTATAAATKATAAAKTATAPTPTPTAPATAALTPQSPAKASVALTPAWPAPQAEPSAAALGAEPSRNAAALRPAGPPGTGVAAPAARAGTEAVSEVELPSSSAAYLDNPKPVYPRRSERLGEQGLVLLGVLVTADGRVKEVSILSSSGFERLDQAARAAVWGWTFVPGKRHGMAQEMAVEVPIRFTP